MGGALEEWLHPRPCADSVVPSVSEDGDDVSACTFKIFQDLSSLRVQSALWSSLIDDPVQPGGADTR